MEAGRESRPQTIRILVGNKKREITLYDVPAMERQRALLRENRLALRHLVHESAYGYVEGKSTWTAAQTILKQQAHYAFCIVCDIQQFFPSINRKRLSLLLRRALPEQVAAEMMDFVASGNSGIAQGSPLSPLLSNCYLYDMDVQMAALADTFYIRYADDILILTETPQQAMAKLTHCLEQVKLQLNTKKVLSGSVLGGFSFLGFDFTPRKFFISWEKQLEMNERMLSADEESRKAIFQGYQAHFRHTNYLRPNGDTLRWILQYASLRQSTGYIRRFSKREWEKAKPVLDNMDNTMKTMATRVVGATVGRAFHQKSVYSAG